MKLKFNDIIKISIDKVYQSKEVIDKEISGYEVISKLLDVYINAVNNTNKNIASNYDNLILKSTSHLSHISDQSLYNRLIGVCQYVAMLSDSSAVLSYKKLNGLSF